MAESKPAKPAKATKRDQWRVAALVAGILLGWFAIVNAHAVRVDFWISTVRAPLIVVIVASAALGTGALALWRLAHKPR